MRIATNLKKRQYLWLGGSILSILAIGLSIWLVPPVHAWVGIGYQKGRQLLLGEEVVEIPPAPAFSPSASPEPAKLAANRMDKMEAGLAAQQIEINQERAQIEQAAQQLQAATTQLNATNVLLQKRQAEWLSALKRIGASVGDSSIEATAAPSSSTDGGVSENSSSAGGLVDINNATADQLDALPGIGPTYAQRIVEYRQEKGSFAKIDDLLNVSGIGPSTFAKFKDKIRV